MQQFAINYGENRMYKQTNSIPITTRIICQNLNSVMLKKKNNIENKVTEKK